MRSPADEAAAAVRRTRGCAVALACAVALPAAHAQSAGTGVVAPSRPGALLRFEPHVMLTHASAVPNGAGAGSGELRHSTRVSVGAGLRVYRPRVRLFGDYLFNVGKDWSSSAPVRSTHSLMSRGTVEWFERRGFLDASATVMQTGSSLFATQPDSTRLSTTAGVQTRRLQLMPSWVSPLADDFEFRVQGSLEAYRTDAVVLNGLGNATTRSLDAKLTRKPRGTFGGGLEVSSQRAAYSASRTTAFDHARAVGVSRLPEWDLEMTASAGLERSTVQSRAATTRPTWGAGLQWRLSPRTRLAANFERRAFGNTHQVAFDHSTGLLFVRVFDGASLQTRGANVLDLNGTEFDLALARFGPIESNPIVRNELALAYLRALGRDPLRAAAVPGYLVGAPTLTRSSSASIGLRGRRSMASLTYQRMSSRLLDSSVTAGGDFALAGALAMHGLSLDVSHRLTPHDTVSLGATDFVSEGNSALNVLVGGPLRTTQRALLATWRAGWTPELNSVLTLRRGWYDTRGVAYEDTSLTASLDLRF